MEMAKVTPQPPPTMHSIPIRRSQPFFLLAALIICCLFFYFQTPDAFSIPSRLGSEPCGDSSASAKGGNAVATVNKVSLEAHIMSKCPDARDCLKLLLLPAMQVQYTKVDWTLSFIGKPMGDDGVQCKHGPAECMGNIIMICAAELYPDPKTSLGFTMCLERDYREIAQKSLIEDCALEHAIDIKALNECASQDNGAYGMNRLQESVKRTSDAGVIKSCTVRLDGENYCIRDGGRWTECPHGASPNDLIMAIEKAYQSANN